MPYREYNELVIRAGSRDTMDGLYACLPGLIAAYHVDVAPYRELNDFLAFIEKNTAVNPLKLVDEEKRLIREMHRAFAGSDGEREVAFLADFSGYLTDYLETRITADDYRYFMNNRRAFARLWDTYAADASLSELDTCYPLLDKFYAANIDRNGRFLRRIVGEKGRQAGPLRGRDDAGAARDVIASLKDAGEIVVAVTGGFHTDGLADLLKDHGVSHLVITPNVTMDAAFSQQAYEKLAQEQARLVQTQTLALQPYAEMLLRDPGNPQVAALRDAAREKMQLLLASGIDPDAVVKGMNEYFCPFGACGYRRDASDSTRQIFTFTFTEGGLGLARRG
jgi:hypothetical protein